MEIGQIFKEKYKIIKLLGQGGMSRVYLVENIKLSTFWALKVIDKNISSKIDIMAEINILKKLEHLSLPRIFDVFEDKFNVYIIEDYISGSSLDKELENNGRFTEEQVIDWSIEICRVLIYLHNIRPNPIIYRDMKPSNIIVTNNGMLKLIDFGIAREYKDGSSDDTVYIGTRGYAAPEQYGIGQTNEMTDIYSLGVTMFELLTGIKPEEIQSQVQDIMSTYSDISEEIVKIITRCTFLRPEDRYQSAEELLYDLNYLHNKNKILDEGSSAISRSNNTSREIFIFRKLILTIWDNAEFAAEISYFAARLTDYKILLINLDFVSPKLEIYLNIYNKNKGTSSKKDKDSKGVYGLNSHVSKGRVTLKDFENSCIGLNGVDNLYILNEQCDVENLLKFENVEIEKILNYAYKYFDLTFISVNKSIFDKYTQMSLMTSDYNIIPIKASIDNIKEYENYLMYLKNKYDVPIEKARFIAYQYNKTVDLPINLFKDIIPDNSFCGTLSYMWQREKYRNLKSFFAAWAFQACKTEYTKILEKFNVIPRKTYFSKLQNIYKKNIKKVFLHKEESC